MHEASHGLSPRSNADIVDSDNSTQTSRTTSRAQFLNLNDLPDDLGTLIFEFSDAFSVAGAARTSQAFLRWRVRALERPRVAAMWCQVRSEDVMALFYACPRLKRLDSIGSRPSDGYHVALDVKEYIRLNVPATTRHPLELFKLTKEIFASLHGAATLPTGFFDLDVGADWKRIQFRDFESASLLFLPKISELREVFPNLTELQVVEPFKLKILCLDDLCTSFPRLRKLVISGANFSSRYPLSYGTISELEAMRSNEAQTSTQGCTAEKDVRTTRECPKFRHLKCLDLEAASSGMLLMAWNHPWKLSTYRLLFRTLPKDLESIDLALSCLQEERYRLYVARELAFACPDLKRCHLSSQSHEIIEAETLKLFPKLETFTIQSQKPIFRRGIKDFQPLKFLTSLHFFQCPKHLQILHKFCPNISTLHVDASTCPDICTATHIDTLVTLLQDFRETLKHLKINGHAFTTVTDEQCLQNASNLESLEFHFCVFDKSRGISNPIGGRGFRDPLAFGESLSKTGLKELKFKNFHPYGLGFLDFLTTVLEKVHLRLLEVSIQDHKPTNMSERKYRSMVCERLEELQALLLERQNPEWFRIRFESWVCCNRGVFARTRRTWTPKQAERAKFHIRSRG